MLSINIKGLIESTIIVSPYDSIQNALNRLGLCHCYAIHNGIVLSTALTFAFYEIGKGESIYIVDNKKALPSVNYYQLKKNKSRPLHQETVNKLRKLFNDKFDGKLKDLDSAFNFVKCTIDPTSSREAAKVHDLSRQKIESNPVSYRKLLKKWESLQNSRYLKNEFPTVLPQKALEPSTDLLPCLPMELESKTSH